MTSNPTDVATAVAIIQGATLPEDTVPVCLAPQALIAEHAALDAQLAAALDTSLSPDEEALALADRIRDLETLMQAATVSFQFRALEPDAFRALIEDHPPRRTDEGEIDLRDIRAMVNVDTYGLALVRACLVEPALPDDVWQLLIAKKLNAGQRQALTRFCENLNLQDADVPFSLAASRLTPPSVAESKQQSGSASLFAASVDGPPPSEPSTDMTTLGDLSSR